MSDSPSPKLKYDEVESAMLHVIDTNIVNSKVVSIKTNPKIAKMTHYEFSPVINIIWKDGAVDRVPITAFKSFRMKK